VALRLLDPAPLSELADGLIESLDDLIVGVVEAVEECVLAPPPDCPNLRTRAEVEAVSWVDDFIADDAEGADDDAVGERGAGAYDGGGVYEPHGARSTIEAKSSPCAHSVPSTFASPRSFHTFDR